MRLCNCDRYEPGKPWVAGKHCRPCWLYHNRDDYRHFWDRGERVVKPAAQCGTALKNLLSWFSARERSGCGCRDRVRVMDCWGPEKCRVNLDLIAGWLVEEAWARRIPLTRRVARIIVRRAIKTAEDLAAQQINDAGDKQAEPDAVHSQVDHPADMEGGKIGRPEQEGQDGRDAAERESGQDKGEQGDQEVFVGVQHADDGGQSRLESQDPAQSVKIK
jgi:hypothetical protein